MSPAHIELALRLLWGTGWRRQRLLFVLQVGVVTVAVAGALLTLILSRSFEKAIQEKLYGYLGALWVRSYGQEVESEPRPLPQGLTALLSESEGRAAGAIHLSVLIESARTSYEGIQLLAVQKSWFEGSWRTALNGSIDRWEGPVAILSEKLARRLQVAVGEEVTIAWLSDPPRFRRLRVVALYHSGLEEIDARIAFAPLEVGQALRRYETGEVQVVHIFLAAGMTPGPVIERLQERLSVEEEIVPIEELFSDIFDWLKLIRQNVVLILGIVVGMSFFVGTAAFLVLMLMGRTRLQVLHCMGMGQAALWACILWQAVLMVGLGVATGSLMAAALLISQAWLGWVKLDPQSYLVEEVPVYWDGMPFAWVILGALGLAIVMGVWVAPSALGPESRLSETVS